MGKPVDRRQLKRRYTYQAVGLYLLIVLFFCHWGYMTAEMPDAAGPEQILLVLEHMVQHPFQLLPMDR